MAPKEKCFVALSQVIPALLLVALVTILAACSRSEPEGQANGPPGAILLTGAGATFPSVLYKRWFTIYHDSNPKIVIKYAVIFLGEIKQWNDPLIAQSNPGIKLPNLTIVTAVRLDGSGTTFVFTKNLGLRRR
jgi:ABC-type phosphate transport system substrate-binding protein